MLDMKKLISNKSQNLQSKNFVGFSPHPEPSTAINSAAPGSAAPGSAAEIFYEGNLPEASPAPSQNPEKGVPNAKVEDIIFSAEEELPETKDLASSVAKELKESMKKSKGKWRW